MIAAPGLRWTLTSALALLTAWALWRAVRSARPADGISHLLHATMAAAMGVMCWPRGMGLPAVPQAVFFAAAALWYPAAAAAGGHGGTGSPLPRRALTAMPHAVVMAGMAWMLYAMDESMSGSPHGSVPAGHGAAGTAGGHHGSAAAGLASMSLEGAVHQTAAGLVGAAFLALALWWLARGFDAARASAPARPLPPCDGRPGRSHTSGETPGDLLCHGVMALVMAVMFVLLT